MIRRLSLLLLLSMVLSACGGGAAPTVAPASEEVATEEPSAPTEPSAQALLPETSTPEPLPTATPAPTFTPSITPTDTPLPPLELPTEAVRTGDIWELNAHLVQLAGNFKVSAQGRVSRIELLDLKKQDGGEIAVIGYLHGEFVEGLAPQPFGTPQKQVFSAAIFGRGEFHVTQGRWKELVGRMQVGDSAEEDVRQNHIALEYFPDVPEQLMDLER